MAAPVTAQTLTAGDGRLRWCPLHQMALMHTTHEGWHWHPLTTRTVQIALGWARYFGLGEAIQIDIVQCVRCEEVAHA